MYNPLEQINSLVNANQATPNQQPSPDVLRKAAMQFEALLLQQLTSSLNGTNNDDEDSLFGSDGGTGLAKQLFSEQLATTMSESGGVGLADLIMRQFGGTPEKTAPPRTRGLSNAISAVRDIKTAPAEPKNTKNVSSFINKSAKFEPVSMNPTNSGEVEIISTFEDEVRTEGLDSSLKNLMLDGRIVNSTRPRIAPNAPVTEIPTTVPPADMPRVANSDARVTYQMPVVGRISSGFGNRFHPIDRKVKFHGGIDIAVPTGTKVGAAADGIVKFAGWKGGYGNVVIIEHPDGSETLYGHNSKLLVVEGQKVVAGEPISLSGSTGKSTGPHVHFEIRQNGQLVNPAKFLSNVLSKNAER